MAEKIAKPFLKWAGGKTQLLNDILLSLPADILANHKFTYIEPFAGSCALLFKLIQHFPNMQKAIINDINEDLVNAYKVVASQPELLINLLQKFQQQYHSLEDLTEKKKLYYYHKRTLYNSRIADNITQAALFIFLNKTCFNGLYRVNKANQFNVPIGSYKKPTICDAENILAVNKVLENVEILCGDYQQVLAYARKNSFLYFDPPYKPLSSTSNFNAYAKANFKDDEQIRLSDFCKKLDQKGYTWMLSNSDVIENESDGNFFDEIYKKFFITKVAAKRSINSNGKKRGELNELLITNYKRKGE